MLGSQQAKKCNTTTINFHNHVFVAGVASRKYSAWVPDSQCQCHKASEHGEPLGRKMPIAHGCCGRLFLSCFQHLYHTSVRTPFPLPSRTSMEIESQTYLYHRYGASMDGISIIRYSNSSDPSSSSRSPACFPHPRPGK